MQKQWAPFLQNSTPSRCCHTAFESLSWFTAHCWTSIWSTMNLFLWDGSHFKRPILERCSYHVSISFVQRCSFRSQQNAVPLRKPDPCNALGVSALARVATHPKQKVWSNSEVGQGNPKLCFSYISKKNDASKNSTIFVEKSTTLFKTLPTLFLVAPSNNLPFALMFYRIECSSSSCQHITPASFGGVRSHRRDENA